jgi:hypothetical protein
MALIKSCIAGNAIKNTGKECDNAMGPTAMLIACPPSTVIDEEMMANIYEWAQVMIHAPKAQRIYPLFGSVAPINVITNNSEADVEVTLDDGTVVPVRYGVYNRTLETIAGGLCYADALMHLTGSGYRVIEIDQAGQVLLRKNGGTPKTYGPLICTYMRGLSPTLATLRDVYRNRFAYSYTPQEMVVNGTIFAGGSELLGLMGLITAEIVPAENASTATQIYVSVQTECAESDLVELFGNDLAKPENFIVTDKETGEVIDVTAANIVGFSVELVGTYVSGKTYHVVGASPDVWFDNGEGVSGYDASAEGLDVTIP